MKHLGHPMRWIMSEAASLHFQCSSWVQSSQSFFVIQSPQTGTMAKGSAGDEGGLWLGCNSLFFWWLMVMGKRSGSRCQSGGAPQQGLVLWWVGKVAVAGLWYSRADPAWPNTDTEWQQLLWTWMGAMWHHQCLLDAGSLSCVPLLLRDKTQEEQKCGGATSELQNCGENGYLCSLSHVMGKAELWKPN